MNKAVLVDTFCLDGEPVTQRWLVTVEGKQARNYFVVRGVQSGKLSVHSPNGAPLTTKVCQTVSPLAKAAIEAVLMS